VLAALGEQELPLSDLAREYEPYFSSGEINSKLDDVQAAVDRVRNEYDRAGVTVDELDGLTFTSDDGQWWFNLRASNTEPFLRLNAEAEDLSTMEMVRDRVLELVRK
jgi:phosphomannomutase